LISAQKRTPETLPTDDDGLRLSNQLCFATYAAALAFSRVYKPVLDPLGLTYPQYLVLLVLWEQDGVTVKEIGYQLLLDSGTLTPLLKRLQAAGIIERTRDAEDERQVRISLTAKGRDLKGPVAAARGEVACASGLPLGELNTLKDQINALRDRLNRQPASHSLPSGSRM
jgi:DNA-binding MarR family transcriptional regulator